MKPKRKTALKKKIREKAVYSVWVGGGEVNDYYITKTKAKNLAQKYKEDGFNDVKIRKEKIK